MKGADIQQGMLDSTSVIFIINFNVIHNFYRYWVYRWKSSSSLHRPAQTFIQYIFIKNLLHARHCARSQPYKVRNCEGSVILYLIQVNVLAFHSFLYVY